MAKNRISVNTELLNNRHFLLTKHPLRMASTVSFCVCGGGGVFQLGDFAHNICQLNTLLWYYLRMAMETLC